MMKCFIMVKFLNLRIFRYCWYLLDVDSI